MFRYCAHKASGRSNLPNTLLTCPKLVSLWTFSFPLFVVVFYKQGKRACTRVRHHVWAVCLQMRLQVQVFPGIDIYEPGPLRHNSLKQDANGNTTPMAFNPHPPEVVGLIWPSVGDGLFFRTLGRFRDCNYARHVWPSLFSSKTG